VIVAVAVMFCPRPTQVLTRAASTQIFLIARSTPWQHKVSRNCYGGGQNITATATNEFAGATALQRLELGVIDGGDRVSNSPAATRTGPEALLDLDAVPPASGEAVDDV
jgi:hypothetical protein